MGSARLETSGFGLIRSRTCAEACRIIREPPAAPILTRTDSLGRWRFDE